MHNFKTESASASRSPILRVKIDSVEEKIHLQFPARAFLEAVLSLEKTALEIGFHTKVSFFTLSNSFVSGSNRTYTLTLQKPVHGSLTYGF